MKWALIFFAIVQTAFGLVPFGQQQPAAPKNFSDITYYWRAFQIPYGARTYWTDDIQGSIYTNMSGTLASNEIRGMRFQAAGRYTNTQYNLTNSTVWIAYNPNTTSSAFQCLYGGTANGIYRQTGTGGKPQWYSAAAPANAVAATLNVVNTLMLVITNGGSVGYWQDGVFKGTFTAPGVLATTDIGNNSFGNQLNGWIGEICVWTNNTKMSTNTAALLHAYAQRFYMPSFYLDPSTVSTLQSRWIGDGALVNGSSQVTNVPNSSANNWPLTNLTGIAATYPIKSNSVWNGHAVIATDGSTQSLANAAFSIPTGGNEVFMAASFNSTVWNTSSNASFIHGRYAYSGRTNASGTNSYDLLAIQTSTNLFVVNAKAEYPNGVDADFGSNAYLLTNKFIVWNIVNNSTVSLLTNNVALAAGVSIGSTAPWYGFNLGVGDVYGAVDYGPWSFADWMVFAPPLTSDQRTGVYNWMTNRYGIIP